VYEIPSKRFLEKNTFRKSGQKRFLEKSVPKILLENS